MTSSSRYRHLADVLICAAVCGGAVGLYSALFLDVPVLTEARDFMFHRGWGATIWHALVPSGSDLRPLSWRFFAWQRDQFGLGAEAANLVQFVLLGSCAAAGYLHVRQLGFPRIAGAAAAVLWLLSLPAFHAAFWQATQHDKLAFLFTMIALSLSLHAIARERQPLRWVFIAASSVMAIAAVATKPVAFALAGVFIAQAVLFARTPTVAGRARALALVALPVVSVVAYALVYASRMSEQWRAYTTGGNVTRNLWVLMRNATNGDHDSPLWPAVALFVPIAAAWIWAVWRVGRRLIDSGASGHAIAGSPTAVRMEAACVYLCAIFAGCVLLLVRARYLPSFYMLIPIFAFISTLIAAATWLHHGLTGHAKRAAAVGSLGLAAALLAVSWTNMTGDSQLAMWRKSARDLAAGYERIRASVSPDEVQSVSFVLPEPLDPDRFFYFFSESAHTAIDQTIPSFIFGREVRAPLTRLRETPDAALRGELVAVWSDDLKLLSAAFPGKNIAGLLPLRERPPFYTPGEPLSFDKEGDGTAFLRSGWSHPENHGTWSDGDEAVVALRLDRAYRTPLAITIWARPFITREQSHQRVRLYANEHLTAEWALDTDANVVLEAVIPAEMSASSQIDLRFQFADAHPPASLGRSTDQRRLGIFLQKMSVNPR